jgi:hypothetical protein
MAITDRNKDALTGVATGAGYGAAIGAPIGGPVGAGVGALAGGVIGGAAGLLLSSPDSEYETYRQEQIDELKRRQEMGLLGLTDEERANLQAQMIDPIRAQQRQQQLNYLGALGGMGGQASDVARYQIGQEARVAEQMQPALTEIARADLAKQRMEEERLMALQREQDLQQRAEDRQRMQMALGGLGMGAQSLADYTAAEAQAKAEEQQMKALLGIIQGGSEATSTTMTDTNLLYNSIYGATPTQGK